MTTLKGLVIMQWQNWFAWYPVVTYNNHIRWLRIVKRRLAVFNAPDIITYWQYSDV